MAVRWTEEQQRVIDTRDCSLLVSAAAGSGKTAVLVERILRIITDPAHPVDIDRLLVVTFTNAAAAEMRERVRDALERKAEENPDDAHLQRQLVLVHNAKITTIHSFCLQVLRSHFQIAGIDPSFRIADEGEVLLLEQDAVQETVEAAYERMQDADLPSEENGRQDAARPSEENGQQDAARSSEENRQQSADRLSEEGGQQSADADARRSAGEAVRRFMEADREKAAPQEADSRETEAYRQFFESFAPGKNDRVIEELILQTYHFALGQPWPHRWLEDCRTMYGTGENRPEGFWGAKQNPAWLAYLAEETGRLLADIRKQALAAIRIAQEPDGPYPYLPALESDLEKIETLMRGADYDSYAEAFRNMGAYARLSTKKDERISPQKKERVQAIRAQVKDDLASLRKKFYYDRVEVLQEEFVQSGVCVRVLTELTEDFMERLAAKKAEKNLLDFGDLEHLALKVLVEEAVPAWRPTAAAREYAELFEEVMIDEYQDSNLVQELILESVAGRGRGEYNRFMVGDVKQSIYRFRLARPELFLEKYRTYKDGGRNVCRIDLHRNFRSRPQVLRAVNRIFRQIMTENPGGIVYDADAALYPGAVFAPRPGNEDSLLPELLLLEASSGEKQEEEARMVGGRIREIVGQEAVWDKEQGCYRSARYGDIVILLRTVSGWAETFGEVLTDMGIPCFTGSQKGYFSAAEVRVVLSYLQILDNPIQDIPLAAVLHSAIGGFDEEELARIRICGGGPFFYDCCQEYRRSGGDPALREKLEKFFAVYEKLRSGCAHTPVHQLLWELLEATGYGEYAAALPGGSQRKANLDMLVEKAMDYEATSYRGLYHFVRYIENLKKYEVDYGEANTGSEAADTVRILSIHKSKGLEFPVVFVSGMGKQFNETDVRARLILHPDYGIGCDFVDTKLRTRRGTLLKRMIAQKTSEENLGEELRVLYVAMTRAKEKLILTGSVADAEKKMAAWLQAAQGEEETLSYSCLSSASTYFDWVMPALLRLPDAKELLLQFGLAPAGCAGDESAQQKPEEDAPCIRLRFMTELDTAVQERTVRTGEAARMERLLTLPEQICYDERTQDYLARVFAQSYPYAADASITAKLSVSELKRLSHQEEEASAQELYPAGPVVPLSAQFRKEQQALTGAARGNAYHTFMENLDFSKKDALELQLEELISCGKMTREEGNTLRLRDIRHFLGTLTGRQMEAAALAGRLYRERPFVLGVAADEIHPDWNPQETVLVQGIIDAYFTEEDGAVVLLDYKTDRVSTGAALAEKYRAQLDYYALALERLTGRPVSRRVLYSFCLGKEILL